MTDEELSKLIREFLPYPSKDQHYGLRSFAKIVATAEREACAQTVESIAGDEQYRWAAMAIRERGEK
jgi:hypothetical protein